MKCYARTVQFLFAGCCAVTGALLAQGAAAQTAGYPVRTIRFVVPFPAGGVNDIVARIVAQKTGEAMRQQWIVDNRPGAGGIIGTDYVAKAAADGYTLLSGGMGSLVMSPLIAKVPYDTLRDFAPIILTAKAPNVLLVHPSLPAQNVRGLIALARSRPGELNYGSGGVGSTPHLSGALFAAMSGINIVHVAYKGSAPATNDLVAGHVQMAILGIPAAYPHIKSGRLRALAVTGTDRSSSLPEVPTVAASGLPGYDVNPWYGVLAPAGTPSDIVARLNAEISKIVKSADMREKFAVHGAEPATSTPEEYLAQIKADFAKWARVIADAGLQAR